jgi:murein DD-endopeptidase MepM/ murein hydrolase activator NlpD
VTRPGVTALAAALLAWAASAPAASQALRLEGPLIQGGLLIGHTDPRSAITVDGTPVRVSPGGLFLVGLGRDAPPRIVVRAAKADGRATARSLEIERRRYDIQRIDGLPQRQVAPSAEDLKRIRDDGRRIAAVRTLASAVTDFAGGFAWPLAGRLSGVFGSQRILNGEPRRPHSGVDVSAPQGTPVKAPADGVVALVQGDMFFTGKTLMIDHGHGLNSVYAHMSAILVERGQRVVKGQAIGRVGATGRATGPHLHWGVSLFDTHLDPALLAGPLTPPTP